MKSDETWHITSLSHKHYFHIKIETKFYSEDNFSENLFSCLLQNSNLAPKYN